MPRWSSRPPQRRPGAEQQAHFLERLNLHGVPHLPQLGTPNASSTASAPARPGAAATLPGSTTTPEPSARGKPWPGYTASPLGGFPAGPDVWRDDIAAQLQATRSMVASLLPALEEPARRVEAELRARLLKDGAASEYVLVHGDFSADQVLVGGSEVRLIDFDRARIGAAEADLGSFAAAEEAVRAAASREPAGPPGALGAPGVRRPPGSARATPRRAAGSPRRAWTPGQPSGSSTAALTPSGTGPRNGPPTCPGTCAGPRS
ncbi:phosphotransferase [Arthrobacter sp. KBS0703]|nr:phosphotransferase [Arthrobacter sp. KBS0703]